MTARELRDILAILGLSQVDAARFLKADERTVRRWCADPEPREGSRPKGHAIPTGVAMLLRLMVAKGITPAEVDGAIGR